MPLREARDTNVKVLALRHFPHHLDELIGVQQPTLGLHPFRIRISRGIPAQGQEVGQPQVSEGAQQVANLRFRVLHQRHVHQGGQRLAGQLLSHSQCALASRTARAISNGHETHPEVVKSLSRTPQALLSCIIARRHELHAKRHPSWGVELERFRDSHLPADLHHARRY